MTQSKGVSVDEDYKLEPKQYARKFYSEAGAKAFASYMTKPYPTFVTTLKTTRMKTTDYDYWVVSWEGKF